MSHPATPEHYNVNIPDVAQLMPMSDAGFLLYVSETLAPFDLTTTGYSECAELKALRRGEWPADVEPPQTLVTTANRKFSIAADGRVTRAANTVKTSLLMHSDTQEPLVSCGVLAMRAYDETGTIPADLRARFMFEQTKESLRTAGYAFTPRYEVFCMNVLYHVSEEIRAAYIATQQPALRVTVSIDTTPQPPKR